MKIEKNKIVFTSVLACILLFLIGYSMLIMEEGEAPVIDNNQIPVPELEDGQKEYESRLEALEDLKEKRQITAPSIYPDHMVDEKGYFNPDYMEYEKHRIIDSIYNQGQMRYSEKTHKNLGTKPDSVKLPGSKMNNKADIIRKKESEVQAKARALEHQLFFASRPVENDGSDLKQTDAAIYARVDGSQTVKKDYRLQMRLLQDVRINNAIVPKNTPIYGFVSFKSNRAIIAIKNIDHSPVKLKAYDFQDGSEGIYIENSFRAEVTKEVVGDIVDDINITGVPQIKGIKQVFQKNNRKVKVTIANNYKLLLKFEH